MIDLLVQNVTVGPDGGLQIGYYVPTTDVKANGVVHLHTLIVPPEDDYDDEIEQIMAAVKHLINDVLEDLPNLDAMVDE